MDRLSTSPTAKIDRDRSLRFTYAGKEMRGFDGDTVASALWASGVRTFSRSFEYHRPRGLYDLEGEGSSGLVAIDGVPNQSSGTTPLRRGMTITAQNVKGSPDRDPYGIIDRFDRWMPAGFYYHLFHRPYAAWPFFQNRMRGLAGLGTLDIEAGYDAGTRTELYLNADVVVIGGGAAGLTAALEAAEHVERVCLFERRPWLGGHTDWRVREHEGSPLRDRTLALAEETTANDRIRMFVHAPVTGVWGDNLITGFQVGPRDGNRPTDGYHERHWECRARAIVVATGTLERPLVFNDNDRPGVMQADTAWRLARHYGVRPGDSVVFSTADDLALEAAADLLDMGVDVPLVADARARGHDEHLLSRLRDHRTEVLAGWAASHAHGRRTVSAASLGPLEGGEGRRVDCDVLVAAAGRQPEIGVLSSAGTRFRYSARRAAFEPVTFEPGVFAAGRLLGFADAAAIEASGAVAGLEAARTCGCDVQTRLADVRTNAATLPDPVDGVPHVTGPDLGEGRKAFLDFDEDGTWKNAGQAAARGFDVPELAKRFGNFGLGPGQYRVPGQNLAMAMAELAGRPLDEIACTTVRPPLVPPTIATLDGPGHDVYKRTALHEELEARGAVFRRAGAWERARYFSDDETCREEIRNVRERVGLLDSSPLGKFRIFGPDALNALQRVYISNMATVRRGRCKYSAMCNDTGNIIDDGVVTRIGEDDYYFTTSSNRAGATVEWFRYHTRYDGWNYNLVNITDTLASINIAGPRSRDVLSRITDADLSNEAFPYMGYREILIGDVVRSRCLRLGFVGELSYELHFPASYARYVWDLLIDSGADFGIGPFGLEAQNCMRAEKGHVIIGTESEQRVTLLDIGMGWMWDRDDTASKKVGAPALRACAAQGGRLKLVGLRFDDTAGRTTTDGPADGALVVHRDDILGYVCTTRYSESLGYRYGLALVQDGSTDRSSSLELFQDLGDGPRRFAALVVPPHFYDPDGARLRS
jgi:sarcosine oxidase subunit alpha